MPNNHKKKWSSRKFITTIVAIIFSITALVGYDMPVESVALVNAVAVIYVIVEGFIDSRRLNT